MPFQHRILSYYCKIGCRNGRGNGQARPTGPMAWMVVIGWFYCWWLLAAVRL
jgi:hypothetical protein